MEWKKLKNNEFWNATELNEELIGTIIEIIDSEEYGRGYIIDTGSSKIQTPSHKVLQNLMRGLKIGQQTKIVYLGEELASIKGHKPTKLYEVYVNEDN